MLGFSFGEIMVISLVALVAVGPQKLPGMLKTMGQWVRKLRQMTMDVRQQTGIDEMLRAEGIQLSELRSLMRGYHAPVVNHPTPSPAPAPSPAPSPRYEDPYGGLEPDPTREYPLEGADAYGALPDDLLEPSPATEVAAAPGPAPLSLEAPAVEINAEGAETEAGVEPLSTEPAVVPARAPVVASPVPAPPVDAPSAPDAEADLSDAQPKSAPSAVPRRSVPPPPPSRSGVPRPSAAPPPPPRRSSGPPRPESTGTTPSKPEATPLGVPRPGNANGNG